MPSAASGRDHPVHNQPSVVIVVFRPPPPVPSGAHVTIMLCGTDFRVPVGGAWRKYFWNHVARSNPSYAPGDEAKNDDCPESILQKRNVVGVQVLLKLPRTLGAIDTAEQTLRKTRRLYNLEALL